MDVLWQRGAGERLPDAIAADIGNPTQAVEQAERLKRGGVDADADIGVAGFDLLQSRTGREGALGHVLGYEERPLVSIDYKDDPRSAIVDALSTMVVGGTQVKVLAWYDNEWGYANRMVDLTAIVAASLA